MDEATRLELTGLLKAEALRLGFDGVGIAPAVAPAGYGHYLGWLAEGYRAGMEYLERSAEVRRHPEQLLPGVRSVVVVSVVYGEPHAPPTSDAKGRIARYARGVDYHEVLWKKLEELLRWLQSEHPGVQGRAVVDSAPLLERDFARLGGLVADEPHEANHCGTCTRCLEACPTDAFAGPYQLDARRCISYWTIEHRGPIPEEFADQLHGWAFGCDICQEVCPWNRKAPAGSMVSFHGREDWTDPDLIDWLTRDRAAWTASLKGTALKRTKRVGLLRNASLILGTRRVDEATAALAGRLADAEEDPTVRGAAAWALGRIGTEEARNALIACEADTVADVAEAARHALRVMDFQDEQG